MSHLESFSVWIYDSKQVFSCEPPCDLPKYGYFFVDVVADSLSNQLTSLKGVYVFGPSKKDIIIAEYNTQDLLLVQNNLLGSAGQTFFQRFAAYVAQITPDEQDYLLYKYCFPCFGSVQDCLLHLFIYQLAIVLIFWAWLTSDCFWQQKLLPLYAKFPLIPGFVTRRSLHLLALYFIYLLSMLENNCTIFKPLIDIILHFVDVWGNFLTLGSEIDTQLFHAQLVLASIKHVVSEVKENQKNDSICSSLPLSHKESSSSDVKSSQSSLLTDCGLGSQLSCGNNLYSDKTNDDDSLYTQSDKTCSSLLTVNSNYPVTTDDKTCSSLHTRSDKTCSSLYTQSDKTCSSLYTQSDKTCSSLLTSNYPVTTDDNSLYTQSDKTCSSLLTSDDSISQKKVKCEVSTDGTSSGSLLTSERNSSGAKRETIYCEVGKPIKKETSFSSEKECKYDTSSIDQTSNVIPIYRVLESKKQEVERCAAEGQKAIASHFGHLSDEVVVYAMAEVRKRLEGCIEETIYQAYPRIESYIESALQEKGDAFFYLKAQVELEVSRIHEICQEAFLVLESVPLYEERIRRLENEVATLKLQLSGDSNLHRKVEHLQSTVVSLLKAVRCRV